MYQDDDEKLGGGFVPITEILRRIAPDKNGQIPAAFLNRGRRIEGRYVGRAGLQSQEGSAE